MGVSLKAQSDQKIDIQRAFDVSPYKYDNDYTKVIKALDYIYSDIKIMWNNYIRTAPNDEYDQAAFITQLDTTVRD